MASDLKQRIGLGSILVLAVIGLFIVDRDYFHSASALVFAFLAIAAQQELYSMLEADETSVRKKAGGIIGAIVLASASFAPERRFEALLGSLVLYLIYEVLTGETNNATRRLAATFLPILVVPVLLSYALLIRNIQIDGWSWVVMLVVACKAGDSSAYLVGSAIGKHKLAPQVSPNKSWEGAIASLLGACLGAFFVAQYAFDGRLSIEVWVGAALVTNIGAQFGDLAESLLKRGCSSKDSASVLPAFGGTFDIVDSFLIAAPALYFFLKIMGVN
ncbi:MAG: phosphatidate cytidylyltransferase [Planctomycetes bacterium]|nr:phosphatidate cytidylyltransferase [Planctomycetota bacterium]